MQVIFGGQQRSAELPSVQNCRLDVEVDGQSLTNVQKRVFKIALLDVEVCVVEDQTVFGDQAPTQMSENPW